MTLSRDQFADPNLQFDAETHSYYYQSYRCTSVTSLIGKFTPPFHAARTAAIVGKRQGKDPKELLDHWDAMGAVGATLGDAVHEFAEWAGGHIDDAIADPNTWKIPPCPIDISRYADGIIKFYADRPTSISALTEVRVVLPEVRLAGTIDVLATDNTTNYLWDFKTGKRLEWLSSRHMKAPIADLFDSSGVAYSLQLSLYAEIVRRRYGFNPHELALIWLDGRGGYEIHKVVELKQHVQDLLTYLS